jgi:phosphate transport system ATP-binding protein
MGMDASRRTRSIRVLFHYAFHTSRLSLTVRIMSEFNITPKDSGSLTTSSSYHSATPSDMILETRGLGVRYGKHQALSDITLPIPRQRITAIVGPSGCGKSSFLQCLNRLTDMLPGCEVTGQVLLDGVDILAKRTDVTALRHRVGMIFQKPNPFPKSIRRNLTFPLREHGIRDSADLAERVERALTDVGLWDEVKDRLDAPALGLSGGQQQRLCLARALALEPEVLLLDEPCSALDPVSGGVIEQLLASLRKRYTLVLVTHNLAQARRLADQVAFISIQDGAGRLIETGAARQVFLDPRHNLTAAYVRGEWG